MRIGIALLLAALVMTTIADAQSTKEPAVAALVAAERGFAQMSLETGTRAAFIANFADDSVLFRPYPVAGKKFMEGSPEAAGLLTWGPSVAEVSTAGDLGWTTGPWEWRAKRSLDEPAAARGFFVSLWRRQSDGSFKVVFDHGTSTPAPATPIAILEPEKAPAAPPHGRLATPEAAKSALASADTSLSRAIVAKGPKASYASYLAADGRIHREGALPIVGRDAAAATLDAAPAAAEWKQLGVEVATSGDLGYTYGSATWASGGEQVYLRIWRVVPDGSWKLVVDVATPVEKPKPKA
jgi:ketosteroid isomerase-like protein